MEAILVQQWRFHMYINGGCCICLVRKYLLWKIIIWLSKLFKITEYVAGQSLYELQCACCIRFGSKDPLIF
eukprot:10441061-Ditylum_brightwellii.AAC.1